MRCWGWGGAGGGGQKGGLVETAFKVGIYL